MTQPQSLILRGIALKLASVLLFVAMQALIKQTAARVPPGEAMAFRSAFAIPVILLWLVWQREAGLGHQFLRHLQRSHVLLHLVDLAPFDPEADPVADAKAIHEELRKYDEALYNKPRWLALNKLDLIPEESAPSAWPPSSRPTARSSATSRSRR